MRILRPATEDEVLAAFVRGELESERFGPALRELQARGVTEPAELLAATRGWRGNENVLGGFPEHVRWFRAAFTPDEVLSILYIDYSWWLEVSGGTRRATDAADRIRRGLVPGGDAADDEPIAVRLHQGPPLPELIVLTTPERRRLVLVEGHVRMTAFALFPEYLPAELELYLGESEQTERWWAF